MSVEAGHGATFLSTRFAFDNSGCHTCYMECVTNMVYLEDERLAREAKHDARHEPEQVVVHCPDCGAQVIVRVLDEINHGKLRGVCRCTCGAVWEVEMAA